MGARVASLGTLLLITAFHNMFFDITIKVIYFTKSILNTVRFMFLTENVVFIIRLVSNYCNSIHIIYLYQLL